MATLQCNNQQYFNCSLIHKQANQHYIAYQNIPDHHKYKNRPSKKSVHFADSLGLALTSVLRFPKESRSSAPTHRSTSVIPVSVQDDNRSIELLNFKLPISSGEDLGSHCRENVCLEKVFCSKFGISGRIQVRNLSFEKMVFVRYTVNSWQTFKDEYASYVAPSTTKNTADTFDFHLKVPRSVEEKTVMQFAVCYRLKESEFWDNNFGDNYRLVLFGRKTVCRFDLTRLVQ